MLQQRLIEQLLHLWLQAKSLSTASKMHALWPCLLCKIHCIGASIWQFWHAEALLVAACLFLCGLGLLENPGDVS